MAFIWEHPNFAQKMVVGAGKLPTLLLKRARCPHYKIKEIYTFGMLPKAKE